MITTLIGKTFLKAFNDKYSKAYSAKEFFEKEYFELFFNHPKYMQWVTNSPFVQGITTDDNGEYGLVISKSKIKENEEFNKLFHEGKIKYGEKRISIKTEKAKGVVKIILRNDETQRLDRLKKFHENIANGSRDGSIAIGYPASEEDSYGTYSGLVSNNSIETSEEDVYYSWIGSGLGIGVAGGYSIFIDDSEILLNVFNGWRYYRKFLNDPTLDKLSGNKINSWNGQWLSYSLGKDFRPDFDFTTLSNIGFFKLDKKDGVVINLSKWTEVFFSLSYSLPNKTLNSCICSLGDVNKTIGFIPIYLKSGKKIREVFKHLFHSEKAFENKEFQSLFGKRFKEACEFGNIGLQALRPDDLKDYMYREKNISFKTEEDTINYQAYKTWLVAMLSKNKEEVLQYTEEIAQMLVSYSNEGTKTGRRNFIKDKLLLSTSKFQFLNHLSDLIGEMNDVKKEKIRVLRNDVYLMNDEECKYLITLLKFDFTYYIK